MAVAQNTVIIDDVEYKPGEQLPELGSIHRVFKDGGKRHYEGLAKDSDKLPLYVANNSSCFMTDTGEYYKFDESKKLWYKPDKIEQSKVTPIEVYGVLNGKIHQVSEDVEGIATPLLYKGSVSDISQLPLSPKIGWMYNISEKSIYGEAGMNVAWTGEIWDALGPAIDMAPYLREDSEIITSLKTKTENLESANYTDRGTLADTDAFLINDGVGMKKSVLSKLSDFVLNKIADKVFAKLQTNDKTILGAINELNSDSYRDILAVSGTSERSVAISDQYNTPLILALFESDKKVLDIKSIPLNFAIQGRTISVYNPKDLSIYAEVVTDKINNTITLKHYGTGFARIYVR